MTSGKSRHARVFHAGIGFEFVGRDDRPLTDVHHASGDVEFLRLVCQFLGDGEKFGPWDTPDHGKIMAELEAEEAFAAGSIPRLRW